LNPKSHFHRKQYIQTNNSEDVYKDVRLNSTLGSSLDVLNQFKMYDDAMEAIHTYLIQKSMGNKMTYTSELVPENGPDGEL